MTTSITALGTLQRRIEAPAQVNVLLIVMLLLMTIGLLMMTSASVEIANGQYGDPFFYFKRQLFFTVLAGFIVLVTLMVPVRFWYSISWFLLMMSFALLLLVLVPGVGRVVNGSARLTRIDTSPPPTQQQRRAGVICRQSRPTVGHPDVERRICRGAVGRRPLLVALAQHTQNSPVVVDVIHV